MVRRAQRSFYYQEIARNFFSLRGAPFVLSSRDLVLISDWEEMRIPLSVVVEGMNRAFENFKKRQDKRKPHSLSFCQREVLRAFEQAKERKVGRQRKEVTREMKRRAVRGEVERFLQSLAPETGFLRDIYGDALRILSRRIVSEDELEKLEERVERIILASAGEAEKEEVRREVGAEFRGRREEELERLFAVRLVKTWREKHRIPRLSFYYY